MKVKELIDYLAQCNPEHEVINDYEDEVHRVIEQRDMSDPTNCFVRLT